MSNDALKDLLMQEASASVPARDFGFELVVMARVARQRLRDSLMVICAGFVAVCALLAIVMPYVTPALIALGQDVIPAVIGLTVLAAIAFGYQHMRPGLRALGLPV